MININISLRTPFGNRILGGYLDFVIRNNRRYILFIPSGNLPIIQLNLEIRNYYLEENQLIIYPEYVDLLKAYRIIDSPVVTFINFGSSQFCCVVDLTTLGKSLFINTK